MPESVIRMFRELAGPTAAPPDELYLVDGIIVRKRPDETLDQAVAREIEQRPKVAAIIRGLKP
jgi:hypothetical protein